MEIKEAMNKADKLKPIYDKYKIETKDVTYEILKIINVI